MFRKKNKVKVLVCLSGGVDSSVAAALLLKKGYDVTAAFMVNYDEKNKFASCWFPDYQDAVRVAAKLGIPIIKLDFTKEYKEKVLDYMYKEYKQGNTPNPDVLCNKYVKFGVWLKKAKEMGFDYLATGHYARLKEVKKICLLIAKDKNKDQTYFLHQLNQEQLRHVLFPIGEYTKEEVRKLAKRFSLPTANKEESMGICFVGEVPMKDFLMKKIKSKKGDIIFSKTGEKIGEHAGVPFYTIGQRHINIKNMNQAFYVIDKNINKNQLIVGDENDPLLYKEKVEVKEVNWLSGQEPKFPLQCQVRLRHRQQLEKSQVKILKSKVIVEFNKPQRAVTPGQFAVFYKNNKCLGGGIIV